MHSNNKQRKHVTGSFPHETMKRGFESWMKRLRSIEPGPGDPVTLPVNIEQRNDQKMELANQEPGARQQSGDEGGWQDDGGESG